jgi:hypothetical protein
MMAFGALMRVSRATIPRLVILLMTQKRHSRASFIHKIGREASINPSLSSSMDFQKILFVV